MDMPEKNFDEINEMFSNLSNEDYAMTKHAAEDYYSTGRTDLLMKASKKLNMKPEWILAWW